MKLPMPTRLGRFIPSILLFLPIACTTPVSTYGDYQVIDAVEEVTIVTEAGSLTEKFKIDTGALRCSIDHGLVSKLRLNQVFDEFSKSNKCKTEEVYVNSANGEECRPVYEVPMIIRNDIEVIGMCSAADRKGKGLKFLGLIGRMTLIDKQLLVSSDKGLTKDQEEAEAEEK